MIWEIISEEECDDQDKHGNTTDETCGLSSSTSGRSHRQLPVEALGIRLGQTVIERRLLRASTENHVEIRDPSRFHIVAH